MSCPKTEATAQREPLVYVAAPYTDRNPAVTQQRLQIATRYTASLLAQGRNAFSPLTYTAQIQELGYAPRPPQTWYSFDLQFLRQCDILEVLTLTGWQESYGVGLEIEHADRWQIPVRYVTNPATDADLIPPAGPVPQPTSHRPDIRFGATPTGLSYLPVAETEQEPERKAGLLIAAGTAVFCPATYRRQFRLTGTADIPPARWETFIAQMRLRCWQELVSTRANTSPSNAGFPR